MSLSVTESGGAEKSAQMSVFVAEVEHQNKNKSGHVPNLGGTAEISNNFRPCRMTGAIFCIVKMQKTRQAMIKISEAYDRKSLPKVETNRLILRQRTVADVEDSLPMLVWLRFAILLVFHR